MKSLRVWWLSYLVLTLLTLSSGIALASPAAPTAQAAPTCPNAGYLADVTIPDYSAVEPGKAFVKTWRVRNVGTCAWPAETRLVFSAGEQMGAPTSVAVGALAAGATTDISVNMKSPTTNGVFRGTWKLDNGKGAAFGTSLTVVIRVGGGTTAATTPATSGSCPSAGYVADVTIPDYSTVEAGKPFVKTWRVLNRGTCAWPADTQLVFVSGAQMGGAAVNVGAVAPGGATDVSVNLTGPDAGGNHTGVWQMAAASSGGNFGAKLSVIVRTGATATAQAAGAPAPAAAASPNCLNGVYVADVTIPDYTTLEAGKPFVKTWRVRNNGRCDWPADTQLIFTSGEQMGGANVAVGAIAQGASADVSVNMTSPGADGNYKGVWSLASGSGAPFGSKMSVLVRVGSAAAPVAAVPPPAAPRPTGGGGFELGGHIRSWTYIPQMQSAAMTWAKIQVRYGEGAGDWINTAHANGFKIQLSALGSPGMVVEPDFHAKYSAWVAGLAASGADAIEVWNEPNIDREWQIGHIDPGAYTQLLCAAYRAIKNANGGTAVISAAPAPTGYFGGCGPNGCDDLPFIQGMYNAGAANCMDYLGAHHNAGATAPSARSGHPADGGGGHHSWYFLPQTELYFNTFRGARKLFYTEMGYASQEGVDTFSDQFAWARGINNGQQAAWLAEAVRLSRSTGMVRCIIVWNIDFSRYGYDPQDGYAIIRPGGNCSACDALRGAMQ